MVDHDPDPMYGPSHLQEDRGKSEFGPVKL